MTNLYSVALDGWYDEQRGREPFNYTDPAWYDFARNDDVLVGDMPSLSVILCVKGGAKVTIKGDVGEGSIILCAGGGATVEVFGDIGREVRIMAMGGAAEVIYHGEKHATALLVARGGGAKVTKAEKPKPVTVLDVQIVVDPAQVGTVHPYRVIIDGASGGPVDLDEAIEELRYAAMNKGQRKGVQAIFEIRQARR